MQFGLIGERGARREAVAPPGNRLEEKPLLGGIHRGHNPEITLRRHATNLSLPFWQYDTSPIAALLRADGMHEAGATARSKSVHYAVNQF